MFITINTRRLFTTLAAGSAVIATFALAPLAAHAATLTDSTEAAVSAPVEHVVVDENGVPSLRVSYAGLDLASDADRAEMNRRVAHAAARVCAPLRGTSNSFDQSTAYQACRSDAIAHARTEIDAAAAN
ncbi:MAG: UrcA family protein [Sphingomonadales bacterium]|nr:UrcA family protein [Sphingomonadales bacterium]MDE2168712.1 UrcA family protein [Sphingomonadales bacterium]